MVIALAIWVMGSQRPYHMQSVTSDHAQGRYRLVDSSSRLLWEREVTAAYGPVWSNDGKAVALVNQEAYDVVLWRKGEKMRVVKGVDSGDAVLQASWSTDSDRLMWRIAGSQGSEALDLGRVTCIDVTTGKCQSFTSNGVHRATWVDDRTLQVTLRKYQEIDPAKPDVPNYRDSVVTWSVR